MATPVFTTSTPPKPVAASASSGGSMHPAVFAVLSPEDIAELQKYTQPAIVLKYPDVMKLLYETPSLTIKEKIYWLQLMPLMDEPQLVKLKTILDTEKEKLLALNKQYEEDLAKITAVPKVSPAEAAERAKALRAKEHMHNATEQGKEEELLSSLSGL